MSCQCLYFDVMKRERKETFTYSTSRKSRNKAMKRAKKEGVTLSSKINEWIEDYIKEPANQIEAWGSGERALNFINK